MVVRFLILLRIMLSSDGVGVNFHLGVPLWLFVFFILFRIMLKSEGVGVNFHLCVPLWLFVFCFNFIQKYVEFRRGRC